MEPLPDGWLDTGITTSVTVGGKCQVRATMGDWYVGTYVWFGPGQEWKLYGTGEDNYAGDTCPVGFQTYSQRYIILEGPFDGSPLQLENLTVNCWPEGVYHTPLSQVYEYEETEGPYRLGVRLKLISGFESANPKFARHYELEYQWFRDENTVNVSSFAGQTTGVRYPAPGVGGYQSTKPTGMTPEPTGGLLPLTFGGDGGLDLNGNITVGYFSDLYHSAATVALGDLNEGPNVLVGSGNSATFTHRGAVKTAGAVVGPGWHLVYDVDLPKFGTDETSGAAFTGSVCGPRTAPYQDTVEWPNTSWQSGIPSGTEQLTITEEDTDLYPEDDRAVLLWGAPATMDPAEPDQYYQPVTVTLADEAPLQISGAENQTLDKLELTPSGETLEVKALAAGGSIRVRYGETGTDDPAWRTWLGVGVSGKSDPAFNPDLAHTTAFPWDWTSYRYLRFTLDAPAPGSLKLTVKGVHVSIFDPHTTGSDRVENFSVTEIPYEVTYTLAITFAGTNHYDLDLLFPDGASEPFYHGRIDEFRLHNWPVGTWTLSPLKLYSIQTYGLGMKPGQVSLKVGFGAPVQRGDYSAIHASHNGANPTLNLGDQAQKPEEIGQYGGALRYINILTGAMTGIIQDSQQSLRTFWEQLNSLAGWSVTWDQDAHDAANKDAFGNDLGGGIAEWSRPGVFRFDAGEGFQPKCHPVVRRITIANGYPFAIYTRHPVHGAVEAILTRGGGPARNQSAAYGGVSASSDSHGFVEFLGVPTGSALVGHSGPLTPRDKPRILISSVSELGGVDLAQTTAPFLFRAYRENNEIRVERSVDAGATWPDEARSTLFDAAELSGDAGPGSAPTLLTDPHDRVWTWVHDSAGAARVYRSENWGGSWSLEATHAGLRFPRAARQSRRTLVVGWASGELRFYESTDDGLTLTALSALTLTAPRQLASLRVDRRDRVHLVYTDGEHLLHRLLLGDDTWSEETVLVAGDTLAGYAVGLERGALLHWSSGLAARRTDETYGEDAGAVAAPADINHQDALGVLWNHGEWLYVCGWSTSGELVTRASPDRGIAIWVEPT